MNLRDPITFDRATGRLDGASALERCAVFLLQAGAVATGPMDHRGYSVGARLVASTIEPRDIVLQLNPDARFSFPLGDGYWSKMLDRNFQYEPEVQNFLRAVADVEYCFIDGGANFGIFSVLLSSEPFGRHPVIAIEPSSPTVARLTRNAALNGNRFKILQRAIGSSTGSKVWLGGRKHEALRVSDQNSDSGESVEMIALDSLLDLGLVSPGQKLVIKLDVEGMEIEAIKGSRRLLASEVVFIVEEHGADRSHAVSRYILNETSCRLFLEDPQSGRYDPLTDVSTLDRIKTNHAIGYNLLATNSPFWEERIRSVSAPTRH